MTEPEKKAEPTKSVFDFVDLITARIGKITTLVGAIGALALGVMSQKDKLSEIAVQWGVWTRPPCVQVDPLMVPARVKYSEWENMKIQLKGKNSCKKPFGLYVTFLHRSASGSRITLRPPHEDLQECKGSAALGKPICWDPEKPIRSDKGNWEWHVWPPPLSQLSNLRQIEKISMLWEVRDYDNPSSPLRTNTTTIEVHNDADNPS